MSDTGLSGRDRDLSGGVSIRKTAPKADPLARRTGLSRVIDTEKIVAVALNPDDEMRNLQVALLYSLTSRRLDELIFPSEDRRPDEPTNANWFSMAQWAVLTVGRNMRTRDVPNRVSMLPGAVRRRITPAVLSLRASDDRRIAAALSFGQVMVLVSTYHAMLHTPGLEGVGLDPWDVPLDPRAPRPRWDGEKVDVGDDGKGPIPDDDGGEVAAGLSATTERRLSALLAREERREAVAEDEAAREEVARRTRVIRLARQLGARFLVLEPGKGKQKASLVDTSERLMGAIPSGFYSGVLEELAHVAGHQDDLRHAFGLYAQAIEAQKQVVAAKGDKTKLPPRSPADLVFEANLRLGAIEQVILDEAVTMVIDHVPQHLSHQAEGRVALFAERTLRVPRKIAQVNASKRIAMGAEIGRNLWARVMTEQVLVLALPSETIRLGRDLPCRDWRKPFYAEALTELSDEAGALFDAFDRSLGDGRGAGAGDWRRWDDRLNFVANLMRSRHDDPSLFWQPFTDEDMDLIWQNRYPSRVVDPFEQAVRSPWFPEELGTDLKGIKHLCDGPGK